MLDSFIYRYIKVKLNLSDEDTARVVKEVHDGKWSNRCPSLTFEVAQRLRDEGFIIPEIIEVSDCENVKKSIKDYHGECAISNCTKCWNMRYQMFCDLVHMISEKYWRVD